MIRAYDFVYVPIQLGLQGVHMEGKPEYMFRAYERPDVVCHGESIKARVMAFPVAR